uniref:NADH-ubiquinone oxidoreductase chain 6 n=1 Tax=Barbourion lemaii TaxID=1086193 RepID=A0A6G6D7X4_9NEOP|nr:NADH dehydrogenase subunit 6 [Barbourion lemaii]QIE12615.1 NADH dehydrogenase subunit 6 [Barbourion lemaii]
MMKLIISFIMIMLSMTMYFMNHPLSMGFMILIQTIMTCMLSGMMIKTYWFSYILFLVFLGGLLVLFIYVSSIASNELFFISNNMKIMFIIMFTMLIFLQMFFYKNLIWMNLNINSEMNKYFNLFLFENDNKINLNKLYNNYTAMLTMMLIIYLFITLIAIVKITNIFYGPLRMSY